MSRWRYPLLYSLFYDQLTKVSISDKFFVCTKILFRFRGQMVGSVYGLTNLIFSPDPGYVFICLSGQNTVQLSLQFQNGTQC